MDFFLFIIQLSCTAALLSLAIYIYLEALGFITFHLLGVAGVGSYTYAYLTTAGNMHHVVAFVLAIVAGGATSLACAELVRPLRRDALTLATFAIGILLFDLFRFFGWTGGVFGLGGIPPLGASQIAQTLFGVGLLATSLLLAWCWWASAGAALSRAVKANEYAAAAIGIPVGPHLRIIALIVGVVAATAGVLYASTTSFIEPRDYKVSILLTPLAAAILSENRAPIYPIAWSIFIVLAEQLSRFIGTSPTTSGPFSAILIAILLVIFIVGRKLPKLGPRQAE